jgi:hypothetical protein
MIIRIASIAVLLACLSACACNCDKSKSSPATEPMGNAHPVNIGIPTDSGTDAKSNEPDPYALGDNKILR